MADTYKYYLTTLGHCVLVTALFTREYFVQPTLVRNALELLAVLFKISEVRN